MSSYVKRKSLPPLAGRFLLVRSQEGEPDGCREKTGTGRPGSGLVTQAPSVWTARVD